MEALAALADSGLIQPASAGRNPSSLLRLSALSHLYTPKMAAHDDVQNSSSMPSTPQSFLYFDNDSPFPQATNEEIWHKTKRRRTQRTSSETQFIHMNGYKSDSQLGTRFNNTYVDSYSDSKTVENSQNKSGDAASTEEDAPVVESAFKANEDRSEPASTKTTRSSRKPIERSTETSSRVLKVKSGTGSSQPTNIQTFIFKTKLDPRLAYRDHSDEPATPTSTNDNTEVKVENTPSVASEPPAKSTRKTRKSEANMLKFKSYTPNATPILRNTGRKGSQQFIDIDSPIPTQQSPTSTVGDYDPGFEQQEKQASPDKTSQFETPLKDDAMTDVNEANSTQRRSTRIRKPVKSILLEETPKTQKPAGSTTSATRSSRPAPKSLIINVPDNASDAQSNLSPSSPVAEANMLHGSRDEAMSETYGTPSPEGLSANTRTSGRLRKPTIKAIEALQSKPRSRKRFRDSDQFATLAEAPATQEKSTPEPVNVDTTASAVSMSRSTSGVGSEAISFSLEDSDILGRLLYDLASNALVDATSAGDNDQTKIDEWREAFNQKKNQEASAAASEVADINEAPATTETTAAAPTLVENINLPGEINEDVALDHPNTPRPWAEEDGWTHTGRVNKFGEEYCVAPADKYQWVKHASNYRTPAGPIPTPPPFIKSLDEIRRDHVYGFPPSPGKRNLYQRHPGQVWRHENVDGLVSHLGSADGSGYGSGVGDALEIEEPGRKTRYIHKRGLPKFKRPLKLVLVDSTKLTTEGGSTDKSALRRRRQSAPTFAEANKPKSASKATNRKRSFEDMSVLNYADQAQHQNPRKKRQSTTKNEIKAEEKITSARQKRQSTNMGGNINLINNNNQPATPAAPKSAASGSKANSNLGARAAHSEKVTIKFTNRGALEQFQAHNDTPSSTISGRSRRRTLGASKLNE